MYIYLAYEAPFKSLTFFIKPQEGYKVIKQMAHIKGTSSSVGNAAWVTQHRHWPLPLHKIAGTFKAYKMHGSAHSQIFPSAAPQILHS
jgi:hypothetical protein